MSKWIKDLEGQSRHPWNNLFLCRQEMHLEIPGIIQRWLVGVGVEAECTGTEMLETKRHPQFGIVKSWTVYYKHCLNIITTCVVTISILQMRKQRLITNKLTVLGPAANVWKNRHLKPCLAVSTGHAISTTPCWVSLPHRPIFHPWGV